METILARILTNTMEGFVLDLKEIDRIGERFNFTLYILTIYRIIKLERVVLGYGHNYSVEERVQEKNVSSSSGCGRPRCFPERNHFT